MISASKRALTSSLAAWAILCATARSAPAAFAEVVVRGNRAVSSDEIRRLAAGAAGGEQLLERVQEAYLAQGYLFARVRLERLPPDSTLGVIVEEGEVARFGRVRVNGANRLGEEEARRRLGAYSGRPFEPRSLDAAIDELLRDYDRSGYPFAQVWLDSLGLDPDAGRVDVNIYVVEGGGGDIREVELRGLARTRPEVAVRLSGLARGERYSGGRVHEGYLRLKASGVFTDVSYPEVRLSPEGQGIDVSFEVIEPRNSHSFTAAMGYADREGARDHTVSGMLRLGLVNIGGGLRDAGVFWRNDGADRSETKLWFRQRFLLGRPFGVGLSLEQVGLDTLYTWQSVGVEMGGPVARIREGLLGLDFALHGDRNTFSVGDISRTLRVRFFSGSSYVWGREEKGGLADVRGRFALARKQMDLRAGGEQSVSQYIVEVGARLAASFARSLHASTEIQFRSLSSDETTVPLSEQFYIGGAATLRGYRENQFHGRRVAYSRSELLVGKSRRENAYIFGDAGYVLEETLLPDGGVGREDVFKFGHGFGLRTASRAGTVDLSFGIGEKFSLRQTKVHIMLDRSF